MKERRGNGRRLRGGRALPCLLLLAAALLLAGCGTTAGSGAKAAGDAGSVPESAAKVPAPQELRDRVLGPAMGVRPGTAGSSLAAARAAAEILDYAGERGLREADPEALENNTREAVNALSDEERELLKECLPHVVYVADETLADPEASKGLFDDAGAVDLLRTALARDGVREDWARLKAAVEAVVPAEAAGEASAE